MSIFTDVIKSELDSAIVDRSMLESDIEVLQQLIKEKTKLLTDMNADILRINGLNLDFPTKKSMCSQVSLKYDKEHEPKYSSQLAPELDWLNMSLMGKLDVLEKYSKKITYLEQILSEDRISQKSGKG